MLKKKKMRVLLHAEVRTSSDCRCESATVCLYRIPKEEMHFQPLEDIAENQEEPGSRHPNMALFNRLLNAAPSPTGFMGGALRRTSAQLQRLRHSPSIDQCTSDDEDSEGCKVGKGGSLPSGLGQETQSTVCSFREEKSCRTPLLDFLSAAEEQETWSPAQPLSRGDEGKEEVEEDRRTESSSQESRTVWLLPPSLTLPPPQTSMETPPTKPAPVASSSPTGFMFKSASRSSLEHCSSQPAINQHRVLPSILKRPFGGNKTSLLTLPSHDEPQRFRSVSMGSELTGS